MKFCMRLAERLFYWDAATAALTVLRALVDEELRKPAAAGTYFVPVARPWPASALAADRDLAARLWAASDVLVADVKADQGNWTDAG